jgi:hypothetical protein
MSRLVVRMLLLVLSGSALVAQDEPVAAKVTYVTTSSV